ncbi:MAG: heavy metal translocating P-type ATPase [Lascolabacillus sp.]|uniref:heavy metal translocating P-type ATPase n=1 Tax=Lascolabacillus sp. TaxID=1924068 RepID=UPI00258FFA31|nr:heavy metal translocating P-type ATPase [Lascolabacillus sp.]MDD3658823.1 heavy metal translocating P-type ATPase [Lascolabacillus sp.]
MALDIAKNIETNCSNDAGRCCGDLNRESLESNSDWKTYIPITITVVIFLCGIVLDYFKTDFFKGNMRLLWYIVAYLPVALPSFKNAGTALAQKDFFNEFTLMIVATLGAFLIGEYPEAVAVMLFYTIGEMFQNSAVQKARKNIKSLLDVRPDSASVIRNGSISVVNPESVAIGEFVQVKAGEKIPLDGKMLTAKGSFNTSALTGESVPRTIREGEPVLAGMVNLNSVIDFRVEKKYEDSSLARVLEMVQEASSRKSKTELFIRRFARIYTPIVFALALAITIIPSFIVSDYLFSDWLYRALVFLVISCPCALVISIPLSYFGGIGAASHNGILFKGANYLDLIAKVNTVVIDKTGTLTEGVFQVQKIESVYPDKEKMIEYAVALESKSNHPIAKAMLEYHPDILPYDFNIENVEEIAGHGMKGLVNGKDVLTGNTKLMKLHKIKYEQKIDDIKETVVIVAINKEYAGFFVISDKVKKDSWNAISRLKKLGIKTTVMLSGDKKSIVDDLADELNIDFAYGDLLPEDKVYHIEKLKKDSDNIVAFVGDGINDAPALAISDVGIAMGGMGSDAAVEISDVVIQTDHPSKIATAIQIARSTRAIVIQNIVFALGVKSLIMILGAFGIASMWEAVFADVGVSLIAILNSIRILRKDFK